MISFWVDQAGLFGITNYLADRGAPIRDRFAVRLYDWSQPSFEVDGGCHIFAALDQLTPAAREAVGVVQDQLAAVRPTAALLNDPRRTLLREPLLRKLSEAGLNRFRVWRGENPDAVAAFPVFLREAASHTGNLTGLLASPGELRRALRSLRVRGHDLADLLIVEYCDTMDAAGFYRKYAAFKVGAAIVPCHLLVGRQWMMKAASDIKTVDVAREELAYVTDNPHAAWLARVFELAGTGFGRVDYGIRDGVPQVWEINLNPTIGRQPGTPRRKVEPEVAAIRDESRDFFHQRLREAFSALAPASAEGAVRVELEPALLAQVARESARVRRRRAVVGRLIAAYDRLPLHTLLRRFFPRA